MKYLFAFVLVVVFVGGILFASAKHDDKVIASTGQYEECVQKEYGVSPAYWYQKHGEYPVCK